MLSQQCTTVFLPIPRTHSLSLPLPYRLLLLIRHNGSVLYRSTHNLT